MTSKADSLGRAPVRRTGLFALVAIAVAGTAIALIGAGGLGDNLVYYWGPAELVAAGAKAQGASIRLGGQVAPGTIQYEPGATRLQFAVTDGKSTVPVRSQGVPPQMFREEIGVVVEGTMGSDGVFEGSRLMVSHGNEYRAPRPGEATDARDLMKSLEGTEGSK